MNAIKRPTKAAIEAALSAYYGEVDEAARKDALPEHQKVFDEIVMNSQDLQRGDHRHQHGIGLGSFRRRTYGEPSEKELRS